MTQVTKQQVIDSMNSVQSSVNAKQGDDNVRLTQEHGVLDSNGKLVAPNDLKQAFEEIEADDYTITIFSDSYDPTPAKVMAHFIGQQLDWDVNLPDTPKRTAKDSRPYYTIGSRALSKTTISEAWLSVFDS